MSDNMKQKLLNRAPVASLGFALALAAGHLPGFNAHVVRRHSALRAPASEEAYPTAADVLALENAERRRCRRYKKRLAILNRKST